ncbi:MAG: hypothetical protein ACREFS_03895, partial [Acetobacteraceae bacterium]
NRVRSPLFDQIHGFAAVFPLTCRRFSGDNSRRRCASRVARLVPGGRIGAANFACHFVKAKRVGASVVT